MKTDTRILLVDDEIRILELYSAMLKDLGYDTKTASHPDEAVRLVEEEQFDIAFIDYFLGPITGLELMNRLSRVKQDLYFVIITGNGTQGRAVESLKRGASDFISKPFFVADLIRSIDYVNKKRDLDNQQNRMLTELETKVNERTEELNKMHLDVLSSLAQAIEKRDLGTYGHCRRVVHYSEMIASTLSLEEKEKERLAIAAMLHDVGKIGISDFILGKPKRLSYKEMEDIKSHPAKGVEILKPLKYMTPMLPAILHHHENFDGSGYPHGLRGSDIPLHARIIAVADTFDAILSNRPYRRASDKDKAINELTSNSGSQFDGEIVHAFLQAFGRVN